MAAPFHSPTLVKRRLTPAKLASALRIVASLTPSSRATVMAASAFCTLCSPGIGRRMPSMRVSRARAAVGEHHVEMRRAFGEADIDRADIGLRREAIGDEAAIRDAADHGLHLGMIEAENRETVERHVLDEALEGVAHLVEGAVDNPDDRDRRWSRPRPWPAGAGRCRRFHRPPPPPIRRRRAAHWCHRH